MKYLYIDFETEVSKTLSLTSMTVRQYLARAGILSVAYALNNDPVECAMRGDSGFQQALDLIKQYVEDGATVVAHNASFDVRVLTQKLGIRWPDKVHCTLEMAQGWTPNQPGGYGLKNLSRLWTPKHAKTDIDLEACTTDELRAYNRQDVEACRALHKIGLARMHPNELRLMELTQNVKEVVMSVDQGKIAAAVKAFDALVATNGAEARALLGETDAFGEDSDGAIRSVKSHALKRSLVEVLGFSTPTITMKKVNPEQLRQNPDAAKVLEATSQVNKNLSHKRRVRSFNGADRIDLELTYFAAHTGRWASRNTGRGLNCIAEGTPILTPRGWVPIEQITTLDHVWDGVAWTWHEGVVLQGERSCITYGGIRMTPDHRILTPDGWRTAVWLAQSNTTFPQALASDGVRCLAQPQSLPETVFTTVSCSGVTAAKSATPPASPSSKPMSANAAPSAAGMIARQSSPTMPCESAGSGAGTTLRTAARIPTTPSGTDTEAEALPSILPGLLIQPSSFGSLLRCPATSGHSMTPTGPLTASTTTEGTTPATFDLPPAPRTTRTDTIRVYDIVNCGPRNRFQAGGMIVHNCHNLPKRNPAVAKPIREMFRLPDDLCFVRGDFANVEYRVAGLLCQCEHVRNLFEADPLADPYAEFWHAATGQRVDKSVKADVPKRQLAKAAVLGLGFMMGQQRWTDELLRSISDPTFKVTLADLEAVCAANRWAVPTDPRTRTIITKLRCPPAVAAVAYYTRERFHQVHPEFGKCARWLEQTVQRAMGLGNSPADAQAVLSAPGPMAGIVLRDDRSLQGQTVRVTCGNWPAATVAWRDLLVRETMFGHAPTFVRAGSKPVARFGINNAIENPVQSAARNGLGTGLLELDRRGFHYVLHVHDEVMIIAPRTVAAVQDARAALLDVFGPGGWISTQGWDWSILINPNDVGISASLWEDEKINTERWPRILAGDETALEALP